MKVVIVGGGYAGVACALRLAWRARQQKADLRIQLVTPRPVLVERIRLHQTAAGQGARQIRLNDLLRRSGVELVMGEAGPVDRVARTIEVGDSALHWDRLVLAAGSRVARDMVPGAAQHALVLEPDTTAVVRARLKSLMAGSGVAVVGGGLTAIEAASEIAESFPRLRVHLVSRGAVAADFSPAARRHIVSTLAKKLHVQVHERVAAHRVADSHLETSQGAIAFSACIWAAGFEPAPLSADAGVWLNARGQVLVDPALRSISDDEIYAAGDIASPAVPPGQRLPAGCKSAMPMGAHVADNIARELRDESPAPFDYALLFYCVSLGRRDGLIQWADAEGRLTGRILTGWRAAWFKETICRSTVWAIRLEARGHKAVVWKQTGHAPTSLVLQGP